MKKTLKQIASSILLVMSLAATSQTADTLRFSSYRDFTTYVTSAFKQNHQNVSFFKHKLVTGHFNSYDYNTGKITDTVQNAVSYLSLINDLDISNFDNHPKINLKYIQGRMNYYLSLPGTEGYPEGITPLSIALVKYEEFKDSSIALNTFSFSNNKFQETIINGYYPFQSNILIGSSALNQVFHTKNVHFLFNDSLFLTNIPNTAITSIKVDYGDGNGLINLNKDVRKDIYYPSFGEKIIKVQLTYNGTIYYSSSKITLINNASTLTERSCKTPIQPPHEIRTITAIGKNNKVITGRYGIWYATCGTSSITKKIRKPYIVCAGFNPGNGKQLLTNNYPMFVNMFMNLYEIYMPIPAGWNGEWRGTLYETEDGGYNKRFSKTEAEQCGEGSSNGNRYYDRLREEGYDIVIMLNNNGTDFAFNNAAIFRKVIQTINTEKRVNGYYFENVVAGYSAGGIASKLALSLMESDYKAGNGPNPHTKMWVSIETENQGANVPIGLQHFINFQANGDHLFPWIAPLKNVADFINIVASGIAKDFNNNPTAYELLKNLASQPGGGQHPYRNDLEYLFAHIPGNTSNGYPEFCRKVGVAQGSSVGTKVTQTKAELLDTKLYTGLASRNAITFPSNCGGTYIWHVPAAEKRTTARWNAPINSGNVFDGIAFINAQLTVFPKMCIKKPWFMGGACKCTGPQEIGSAIVIGESHVPKPSTNTNIDDVPASFLSSHIELYEQSAYKFYNNTLLGGINPTDNFARRDESLHAFAPTVSTLDLRNPTTGLPASNYTSPDALDLLYINPTDKHPDRRYGFPYIKHPNDHYKITPYDAVFAIGINNGTYSDGITPKPANQMHVEDPQIQMGEYLATVEVAPENLFLSNRNLAATQVDYIAEFEARNKIIVGNNIYGLYNNKNNLTPNGDFNVNLSSKAILHAGTSVELLPGTTIAYGAQLHVYIQPYECENILRTAYHPNGNQGNDGYDGAQENYFQEQPTKIESLKMESGLKVYPNPSAGVITVASQNDEIVEVRMMDLSGKIVYKELVNNVKLYTIDLPLIENGIYLMEVLSKTNTEKFKIVIAK